MTCYGTIGTWALGACLITVGPASAGTILVPGDYPSIQDAVDAAVPGDEIVIADGTYTGSGNRDIDFGGKAITVRSCGDDPTQCVIDSEGLGRGFVFTSGETAESVLRGVTITRASGFETGGGILCMDSSPTIVNCILRDNAVGGPTFGVGGGLFHDGGAPTIIDCVFEDNGAFGTCFSEGGGAYSCGSAVFRGCEFIGNRASGGSCGGSGTGVGGGLSGCGATIEDCRFIGNLASGAGWNSSGKAHGGGVAGSSFLIMGCVFKDNVADAITYDGSAIAQGGGLRIARSTVRNCYISLNRAIASAYYGGATSATARGGGVYVQGTSDGEASILDGFVMARNVAEVDVSVGQGDDAQGGGLYMDVACSTDDFVDGRWCDNVPDDVCDGCVGCIRFECPPCPGDFDSDAAVDFTDLTQLLGAWGPCTGECLEDLDGNGDIGFADLTTLLSNWGPCG